MSVLEEMKKCLFPMWLVEIFIDLLFRLTEISIAHASSSAQSQLPLGVMRAREHIKLFIGEYNALCDDSKYYVLERIMKKIIFEGKKLRDSLLKEMLTIEKLERLRF